MFENPLVVFLVVIFVGMYVIGKVNDICSFGDLFNGNVFSWSHHNEHINREFNGFFYVLCFALCAGGVVLIYDCFSDSASAQKRVFIKDVVSSKQLAQDVAKHKVVHPPLQKHALAHHAGQKTHVNH